MKTQEEVIKEDVIRAAKGDNSKILKVASFLARKPISNFFEAVKIIAERVKQGRHQVTQGFNN